ncbi:hypothetical protein ACFX1R_028358 [Malus domestica]
MRGISENAVRDIFEHIKNTPERDFVLKFSALEIYNETVVDLLKCKSGSLWLLDDSEKSTIVDKPQEEIVENGEHLRHLIGIFEAQRQVGETALNDKSSRSHQIIRLLDMMNLYFFKCFMKDHRKQPPGEFRVCEGFWSEFEPCGPCWK